MERFGKSETNLYHSMIRFLGGISNSDPRMRMDQRTERLRYLFMERLTFRRLTSARQWFRPDGGILAWLPLPGRRISIVWSAPDQQAAAHAAFAGKDTHDKPRR